MGWRSAGKTWGTDEQWERRSQLKSRCEGTVVLGWRIILIEWQDLHKKVRTQLFAKKKVWTPLGKFVDFISKRWNTTVNFSSVVHASHVHVYSKVIPKTYQWSWLVRKSVIPPLWQTSQLDDTVCSKDSLCSWFVNPHWNFLWINSKVILYYLAITPC